MFITDGEHELVIVATPGRGPTEIYVLEDLARLRADFDGYHAHFASTHPNANEMRALHFGGNPETSGRGFRQRWREFLLLPDVDEAPPADERSETPTPLQLALMNLAQEASAEYGQPVDHIRISIAVLFRSGELLFHWGPNDLAQAEAVTS
jgi:hypothetical protein